MHAAPIDKHAWAKWVSRLVEMETNSAVRRIPIDRCGWPGAVIGWETTSDDMGLFSDPESWSDPAHVQLTPMPTVNNAMVNVHAAVTNGPSNCGEITHCDFSFSKIPIVVCDCRRCTNDARLASAA